MNDLLRPQEPPPPQDYASFEGPMNHESQSPSTLIRSMLKRWHIILLTFVIISAAAVPAVWRFVKPTWEATAAIQVAPVMTNILFSDRDSEGAMPLYENFKNSQAYLIKSDQVLQKAADELADKKLSLFQSQSLFSPPKTIDPFDAIKAAVVGGAITVTPERRTEYLIVSMVSPTPHEAEQIVNAIINAYMIVEGSKSAKGGERKLRVLEDELKALNAKVRRQVEEIRQRADEYGSDALTGRQNIMLERVAALQAQLTNIEATRLGLEVKFELLQQTKGQPASPEGLLERRQQFIQADLIIDGFTKKIAQLEQELVTDEQNLSAKNPKLKQNINLLEACKTRLNDRRAELEKLFDDTVAIELSKQNDVRFTKTKAELEQTAEHEKILRERLENENTDTIQIGRKQLAINEAQEQINATKELSDIVRRRIQELEMEQKRPARISIAFPASTTMLPNKRIKFTAAAVFVALASGLGLAFLKAKADKNLYTPDDVIRRIGVPVIGTTTSTIELDRALLPERIANDYQAIRANLKLLSQGDIPKILAVTSAAGGEGKTTLSINLAISLTKAGNKVLLIDGDLRKPDISHILNLPVCTRGMHEVMTGATPVEDIIYSTALPGMHVLAIDDQHAAAAIEELSKPHTSDWIRQVAKKYDHIIIDTPPILAAPDALLWAAMADAVVLSSLAGRSAGPELKDALDRLTQIDVRILGNVLSNVKSRNSYHPYGYSYYGNNGSRKDHQKRQQTRQLVQSLIAVTPPENPPDQTDQTEQKA